MVANSAQKEYMKNTDDLRVLTLEIVKFYSRIKIKDEGKNIMKTKSAIAKNMLNLRLV